MTESEIEVVAIAIRNVFVGRVYREGMPHTSWEKLKEYQREAYREESQSAISAYNHFRGEQ